MTQGLQLLTVISSPIDRKVSNVDRLIEIVKSMPSPQVEMTFFNRDGLDYGIPQVTVHAANQGGACVYEFKHSGLMGLEDVVSKVNDLMVEGVVL